MLLKVLAISDLVIYRFIVDSFRHTDTLIDRHMQTHGPTETDWPTGGLKQAAGFRQTAPWTMVVVLFLFTNVSWYSHDEIACLSTMSICLVPFKLWRLSTPYGRCSKVSIVGTTFSKQVLIWFISNVYLQTLPRTRAERLHTDMFHFLNDASEAYLKHFTKELQAACERGGLQVIRLNCKQFAKEVGFR